MRQTPKPRGGRVVLCALAVFGFVLGTMVTAGTVTHANTTEADDLTWWAAVEQQLGTVWSVLHETAAEVVRGAPLQIAQVGGTPPPSELPDAPAEVRSSGYLPSGMPEAGTLVINTPLEVDDTLTVTDRSTLATTTIDGQLTAAESVLAALTVAGDTDLESLSVAAAADLQSLAVAAATDLATLTVGGESTLGPLTVTGGGSFDSLAVAELAELVDLVVAGSAELDTLAVSDTADITGRLRALGGIDTEGADVDLGDGELFASNVVNEVVGSEFVTITGPRTAPVISIDPEDFVGVMSLNDETGELTLQSGPDILISGLRISNRSTLSSVRSRGGCTDCITDSDVETGLTITGGVINDTPIGSTTPSTGRFTTLTVGTSTSSTTLDVGGAVAISDILTVSGTATSTFAGSINITDGCLAIDGECVEGLEPSTYVSLTDTPSSLLAGAVQFVNQSGDELTQSSDFVFADGALGLGTSTPSGRLSVVGDSTFVGEFTVDSATSSQFIGGLNVTDGCVSVDGVCIEAIDIFTDLSDVSVAGAGDGSLVSYDGSVWRDVATSSLGLGDGSFIGLADTPDLYVPSALSFVNASGTALTQSSDLVFTDGRFGIGTSTPTADLTLVGDMYVSGAWRDGSDSAGAVGDLLQSTGTSTRWIQADTFGDGTFLGLSDTPSSYISGALQFANATGTELTQSGDLVFVNGELGLGTDTPRARLTVDGDIGVVDGGSVLWYDEGSAESVGFRAPASLSESVLWTLPEEDGELNQILTTDGAGQLTFQDVSAIGSGANTYLELLDTPSDYATGTIPFVNASSTELTQSEDFVFRNGRLGLGVNEPTTRFDFAGDMRLETEAGSLGMTYQAGNRFGFGTENPDDFVTVQGGSINQRGGTAESPYNPRIEASIPLPDNANDIEIVGNYAYIVTNSGGDDFHVVDITNPLDPIEVSSINLPAGAQAIAVRGQYAYVVTEFSAGAGRLHVIDINDPLNPVEVADRDVVTTARDITISGRFAYVAVGSSVRVLDISDPIDPIEVGSVSLADRVNGLASAGSNVYAVTSLQGDDFHVINIEDPHNPVEVSSLNMPDTTNDVTVRGGFAYVVSDASDDDFHVIDISDPQSPAEVGGLELVTAANAVFIAGRYAYVTTQGTGDDLHVIDILDPLAPVEVGGLNVGSGNGLGVFVKGRYAYFTSSSVGNQLHTIDISGVEVQSAMAHSLEGGTLSVQGDSSFGGRIVAGLGLRAGSEGLQTDGALSVLGEQDSFIAGRLSLGTTSANHALTIGGDVGLFGALHDEDGNAGSAGDILQSTGSGVAWVSTSTLALGEGIASFLDLDDTPETYSSGRLLFTSSSADGVTDSADLTYDGSVLSLGGSDGLAFAGERYLAVDRSGESLYLGQFSGLNDEGVGGVFVGDYAGENNSGDYATLLGYGSGGGNAGDYVVAVGHLAGSNNWGAENVLLGNRAGFDMTGSYNLALGSAAGYQADGSYNEFLGFEAGRNVQGTSSTIVGSEAFRGSGTDAISVSRNVAVGRGAGASAMSGASDNVLLGFQAGSNLTTGARNIVIGSDLELPDGAQNETLVIGNLLFGTGVDGSGATVSSGNIGIGTSTPSERLTVAGTMQSTDLLGGATNLTTDAQGNIIRDPSDERLKENIEAIDDALEVVLGLQGVRYDWIDEQRFGSQREIGFIAQEVQKVLPEAVRQGGDYWSLNTRNMLAIVVEAVKELWDELRGTQAEVAELEERVEEVERLRERVDTLESALNVQTFGGSSDANTSGDSATSEEGGDDIQTVNEEADTEAIDTDTSTSSATSSTEAGEFAAESEHSTTTDTDGASDEQSEVAEEEDGLITETDDADTDEAAEGDVSATTAETPADSATSSESEGAAGE